MESVTGLENDREFKSHVYQQLVELQPFLSPESQISVLVEVDEADYALTLVATLGEYKIEAEARDEDLYTALGLAKRHMIAQLEEIYSAAIDSAEREEQIQNLLKGSLTLH